MTSSNLHIRKPALIAVPTHIRYAADYELAAREFIADDIWSYLQEGCEKPFDKQINRRAFDRLQWLPRQLKKVHNGSAQTFFLGESHTYPMMLAPIAYHQLVHPQAELAMAEAAAVMQMGMIVSSLSSERIEKIAEVFYTTAEQMKVEIAPLWFQLYWQADKEDNAQLLKRAEAAGYTAIVWTVDAQYKRSDFNLPEGVSAVNLAIKAQEKVTSHVLDTQIVFQSELAKNEADWSSLAWLKQHTNLPIIIKGILSPDDAVLAKQYGADAIIVSNHGNRVLPDAISPLTVLASIKQTLNDASFPVLMDSGIRSGADIAKALALGASTVLIGRPQIYALAVAGSLGVAHLIHLLRAELELTMAQLGTADVHALSTDLLWSES